MATWAEARAAKAERQRREARYYTPDKRGPRCRVCGGPTDPVIREHPCCMEPEAMRRGAAR